MTDLFGMNLDVKSDDLFDIDFAASRIYDIYPRKSARKASIKAIVKAIKYNAGANSIDLHDSSLQLMYSTEMFAKSPDVKEKQDQGKRRFICMCATWFNQGRYTDDDEENGYVSETKGQKDIRQELIDLGLLKE